MKFLNKNPIKFLQEKLADRNVEKAVKKVEDEIAPSTKELLLQMDPFSVIASTNVPELIIGANENATTNEDLETDDIDLGWKRCGLSNEWKSHPPKLTTHKVSKNLEIDVIREDDIFGKISIVFDIGVAIGNGSFLFPFEDKIMKFKDQAEADQLLKDVKLAQGMACPSTYNKWGSMSSDESFNRYFFHAFGAVNLIQQKETSDSEFGPFVVDLPLHEYKVRPG